MYKHKLHFFGNLEGSKSLILLTSLYYSVKHPSPSKPLISIDFIFSFDNSILSFDNYGVIL